MNVAGWKKLENLIIQINEAYENTNKVHLYITKLATLGESVIVMGWVWL